jgi:uncharacterized protein involved in copper resistance
MSRKGSVRLSEAGAKGQSIEFLIRNGVGFSTDLGTSARQDIAPRGSWSALGLFGLVPYKYIVHRT